MKRKIERYAPSAIEAKWRDEWARTRAHETPDVSDKPNFYFLTMFPYPSGDIHVGHWYAFAPADCAARYLRMRGHNVLFPMGFDAFGINAENAAIDRKIHPAAWTEKNMAHMRDQFRRMGAAIDWRREVVTCYPEYYRWNQWMFLRFYEKGLAYRGEAPVNWCPRDETVLANEQVIAGRCERCDTPVVKRLMTQWFFKITAYADELLRFDGLDWPERDHGRPRARRARLRVREEVRPRDPRGHLTGRERACGAGRRLHGRGRDGPQRPLRRDAERGGQACGRGGGDAARHRRARGDLPAARLADIPTALLGHADPDRVLRFVWPGAGPVRPAADRAAPGRRVHRARRLAAGPRGVLREHDLPPLWEAGEAGHRHDGHVRRLVLVHVPLPGPDDRHRVHEQGDRAPLAAGRAVHRRHRARDPASAVHALRLQGAARPWRVVVRRAGAAAAEPGDDHLRRPHAVEVAGQRADAGRVRREIRRRHAAPVHDVPRAMDRRRRLGRVWHRRRASLPEPRVDAWAGRGGRRPSRPRPRSRGPSDDRKGDRGPRRRSVQHGDRRDDGALERAPARALPGPALVRACTHSAAG